ncbi:hypothetical protein Tco_0969558 [Tanacetum coccineum]
MGGRINRICDSLVTDNVLLQAEIDEEERQRIAKRLHSEERKMYSEGEKARLLAELINERKRYFAAQRAEERRNKPLTQAQQRTYIWQTGTSKRDVEDELVQGKFKETKDWRNFSTSRRKLKDKKKKNCHKKRIHHNDDNVPMQGIKSFDREDLVKLWSLVKEKFISTELTEDKERELWVELKKLFEPDTDDELWKLQKHIHDVTWRLYDTCGVDHVSTKDGVDIYMLVEKEYPLSRGVLRQMLVVKLLVEQDSKMSRELLRKIFHGKRFERPRR